MNPADLPPLGEDLYEFYPAMSAQTHEDAVKAYARRTLAAKDAALAEALLQQKAWADKWDHAQSDLGQAKTSRDNWKESHGRVVEGFAEVCEAVGVQFDAPEAVAYAINAKISNAEYDKRAALAALAEMRVELERQQDEEDKAARDMQVVIQGLRDRATAAEAELERAKQHRDIYAKAFFWFSKWPEWRPSPESAKECYADLDAARALGPSLLDEGVKR